MKRNIIVLLIAAFAALAVWGGRLCPAGAESYPGTLSINVIKQAIRILGEEYVEKTDPVTLLQGAVSGLQQALKAKKIKVSLAQIPKGYKVYDALNTFEEDYRKAVDAAGGKIRQDDLIYSALNGLMAALKDPYSVAYMPKEYKQLQESMGSADFGGVGIVIELDTKRGNQLTIVEPIEGTPAEKAGLRAGDAIIKINGQSTNGIKLDMASQKIRGPIGSQVTLTVKRKEGIKDFTLVRANIHIKSVVFKMYQGGIGYVKLRSFGEETGVEFAQALSALQNRGARGLIIDLRNNGGGYIRAAIDVCNHFLPANTLIVSVVNYRRGEQKNHRAKDSAKCRLPLLVLVNEYSASASEITAGAIQDTGRGVLYGVKTFGKGSVQSLYDLKDGGALKYTVAYYLTPRGKNIHKKGLKPNVEFKMEPRYVGAGNDIQLGNAIVYMKTKMLRQP
jgi:carboxyl-terminal processing protease